VFPSFLLQISVEIRPQRHARKAEALKICLVGLMAPWVYNEKFPAGTQFLFKTLMFTIREDENLKLQVRGPPLRQWAPIYGGAPYYPDGPSSTTTSASDDVCSNLNPCAGPYTLAAMMSWGHPIGVPMFHPSDGTLSSTSLGASTDRDSIKDYPEIGGSTYWNPTTKAHHISMVGPNWVTSRNILVNTRRSGGP
jgi:hypothetical protein